MLKVALDGDPDERRIARLCLIMDYSGQRRESNGQFGTGKKPGSGSGKKAKNKNGTPENKSGGKRGNQQSTSNSNATPAQGKSATSKPNTNPGGNISTQALRAALMSLPKEKVSGIRRHVMDDAWHKQRDECLANEQLPRSGITISEKRIRSMVRDRLKAGDFNTRVGSRGDARARMMFDTDIGIAYDKDKENKIQKYKTKLLEIVYSPSDGYHFYPVPEKE